MKAILLLLSVEGFIFFQVVRNPPLALKSAGKITHTIAVQKTPALFKPAEMLSQVIK